MSILSEFSAQLDAAKKSKASPTTLIAADRGDQLRIVMLSLESIGCAFELIDFQCQQLQNRSTDQLQALADELARRITYLMEPIRTVEVDTDHETVQMRSDRPQSTDQGKCYYELLARPGSIQLCRYLKRPGASRQRVAAQLTQEVLVRLIGDLADAVE